MIHIKSFLWNPCYAAGQPMTVKYSESLHTETSCVWYVSCTSILFLTDHPLICSLLSFMLKGFSFPIQKLIEWEVLLPQHVRFPDSYKENGGNRPDAQSDTTFSESPCFQQNSILRANSQTPCTVTHFIAFPILQSSFLCDFRVLQNVFSPRSASHMCATYLMIVLEKKLWLTIHNNPRISCFAQWQRFFRLLFKNRLNIPSCLQIITCIPSFMRSPYCEDNIAVTVGQRVILLLQKTVGDRQFHIKIWQNIFSFSFYNLPVILL